MGRPSFLPCWTYGIRNRAEMCQCPERGVLHFYVDFKDVIVNSLAVSMPWMGRPSFLPRSNAWQKKILKVFQCPEWGDLHFYLASGNPCKSRLCGSIFLEVFQNILKKAFLKGVFWKFTICSYLTVPFLLLVYLFFLGLRSTYSTLLIG